MTAEVGFDRLIDELRALKDAYHELARRQNNFLREARVLEVLKDGTAIVDAQGLRTSPRPWLTRAGNVRDWDPPSIGERVLLISPNGDPAQGHILPGGYSDAFPQNHDDVKAARRNLGDTELTITEDGYDLTSETVTIEANTIVLKGAVVIEGEALTHNGKNVGHDHEHTDVEPGSALTGPPAG